MHVYAHNKESSYKLQCQSCFSELIDILQACVFFVLSDISICQPQLLYKKMTEAACFLFPPVDVMEFLC